MHPIIGRRILVLTAHPDDEAFAAGGTIKFNADAGGITDLVCATRGEKGRAHLDYDISDDDLKKIRTDEFMKAVGELKIRNVRILDYPDRSVASFRDELLGDWAVVFNELKPEIILSFGKDGYTGNVDHIAVGDISHQLATEHNLPFYSFALPDGNKNQSFRDSFLKKRKNGIYIDSHEHSDSVIKIEIDPEFKYNLLKIHATQFPGLDPFKIFSKEDAEHFLRFEYFSGY